ncbi:hypothetical protein A3J91_05405 [Candidatus Peribacteria bacterium RIFOXYC2_FULL_58_10]|nr:MAG: hypothetical protein A3J91_05405 [Candidatus Peribacteria bacterium RIFOXYC2_FULL_58_10]OGJ84258.1 MAG: hypothetical protein A2529_00035 [Candidatus Peribacteria bacterium RIFOXYD2_FULL_58_15]
MQNLLEIVQNLFVRKTKDAESFSMQDIFSFPIVLSLLSVYTSIDFNDQTSVDAEKISNEPFHGSLPPELETGTSAVAESAP